ncbi:MAG: hypothetical protein V4585_22825 [Bacteroidota bacterium]|jgi:hypothetical protein
MKKQENIDKIFSDGLHAYERQPHPQAWEKLEARLQKPQSRTLPLWWKFASAASLALLLGTGGYWYNSRKSVLNINLAQINKVKIDSKKEATQEQVIAKTVVTNLEKETIFEGKKSFTKALKIQANNAITSTKPPKLEEILSAKNTLTPTLLPEIKKTFESNTIVLVLENNKPKVEEETIVLNMIETQQEAVAQIDPNEENIKKQSRLGKIWQQLKRAKNGEDVNWGEVGIKPQKVLARADAKIENALTKGENNEK